METDIVEDRSGPTTISKTIFINAPAAKVWDYLTERTKLGAWFHPAREDLALGQDYTLIGSGGDQNADALIWGNVLAMEPPRYLSYTFLIPPFDGRETVVSWTLEDVLDGTRLSMTHEGIAAAAGDTPLPLLLALDDGWDKHLNALRAVGQ